MIRKLLLAAAALAPLSAHAGLGTTFYVGAEDANNGFLWGTTYPSLDIYTKPVIVQIHAMEFLRSLTRDDFYLGANAYLPLLEMDVAGQVTGVVQPGLSLDLSDDPFTMGVAGLCRLGGESTGRMGLGIYVVPAFGFAIVDDDFDLLMGGTLQLSAWVARMRG